MFGGLATPPGTFDINHYPLMNIAATYVANFACHEETPSLLLLAFLCQLLQIEELTDRTTPS
jgi:hypothetical protein